MYRVQFKDLVSRYGPTIIFNPIQNPQANPVERVIILHGTKPTQHAPFCSVSSHSKISQPWQIWSIDYVGLVPRSSSWCMFDLGICKQVPVIHSASEINCENSLSSLVHFYVIKVYIVQFKDLVSRYGSTIIFNPIHNPLAYLA